MDSEAVERAANDGPADQSPEQILTRQTLDADLQAALDALPDAFRQAVWLRDVEELSYAEMAKVLDVPIGTVMSRISRGRRALSEGLAGPPRRAAAAAGMGAELGLRRNDAWLTRSGTARDLDEHLAPFVDGEETPAARASVEAHLAGCPPCQQHADDERAARDLVHDHRDELRAPAPEALRARCADLRRSSAAQRHS